MEDYNIDKVLNEIREKKESDDNLAVNCHILVHELGRVYVYKNGGIDEENDINLRLCDNAFVHGEEEGLSVNFTRERLVKLMPKLCSISSLLKSIGNCNHGLGHLAYWHEGDFWEGMKLCSYLLNINDIINCSDGVAMSFSEDYSNFKVFGGGSIKYFLYWRTHLIFVMV
jgi:hypothetical protein